MPHKANFTAQLSDPEAVRKVAASVGCVQTRGPQTGQGSIRLMLERIGRGEIVVREAEPE